MGLSETKFRQQFLKKFGISPRTYLTKVRLAEACRLLVTTELPLSDVALRTGFYDQSHFSNQFSKRYGVPPSKYRSLHMAGGNEVEMRAPAATADADRRQSNH
jgi:AraC-like DNA-binding protein